MRAPTDAASRAHDGSRLATLVSRGRKAARRAFRILVLWAGGVTFVVGLVGPIAASSPARAQGADVSPPPARPAAMSPRAGQVGEPSRFVVPDRNRINAGTVTVITAPVGGALAPLGSDLARVLDSDELRVLPILGKGSVQNIIDILYLKNVDLGFAYSDALEFVRTQYRIGDVAKRVAYITKVYNSDVHIVAPVEIKNVRDLAGKRIMSEKNLGYFSARTIFDRLGIDADFDYDTDDALGLYKMSKGEADAWIVSAGRIAPIVRNFANEGGKFHLVPIPYEETLLDIYAPSNFTNADYPNLIQPDETVPTVSASLILMAFNWPEGSERYNRVKRFVDAFFSHIEDFQNPARHPKWRETNLVAEVPGWQRLKPAQDWLVTHASSPVGQASVGQGSMADEFQQFLAQRRATTRRSFSQAEIQKLIADFDAWRSRGAPAGSARAP
jgi:TRAP-type uncharacterized transport system substrate-binding protein